MLRKITPIQPGESADKKLPKFLGWSILNWGKYCGQVLLHKVSPSDIWHLIFVIEVSYETQQMFKFIVFGPYFLWKQLTFLSNLLKLFSKKY